MKKFFKILVPNYNNMPYVKQCLDSILNLTFQDYVVIFADDLSTDGSDKFAEMYSRKYPDKIIFHRMEQKSYAGKCRNYGISYPIDCEYYYCIDSDDYLLEHTTLQKMHDELISNGTPAMMLFKWVKVKNNIYINCNALKFNISYFKDDLTECPWLSGWTRAVKASSMKPFLEKNCMAGEDTYLFMTIADDIGIDNIKNSNLAIYAYRQTNTNTTKSSLYTNTKIICDTELNEYLKIAKNDYIRESIHKRLKKRNFRTTDCNVLKKQLDIKIDYVITYVDFNDIEWKKEFDRYSPESSMDADEQKKRFELNTLFKYVFRGIEKYMPWINKVFLVVSSRSQVPSWLDQSKITVITHDLFIPEEYLPTFNSGTIECFLHMIPGLSQYFIYGNDDMYITNRTYASDFFTSDNMPLNSCRYIVNNTELKQYEKMNVNMTLLALEYVKSLNIKTPYVSSNMYMCTNHNLISLDKFIMKKIFNDNRSTILDSISRFRTDKTISLYFFTNIFTLLTNGKYVNNNMTHYCIDASNLNGVEMSLLQNDNNRKQLICVNDNNSATEKRIDILLSRIFNSKSSFEI